MKSDQDISTLKSVNTSLQARVDELVRRLESAGSMGGHFSVLSLAETILENSTAVLFRRLAAKDIRKRKMVYVSPSISCFGYQADDFLEGKIMFRDIVFPEDNERTIKEIENNVARGIDAYTQTYRIVTGDGSVRWVEDRTSIYKDDVTGLTYHQGIVIDIHEQKKALQLAAEVQKSFLPERAPTIEGLDIAGTSLSCDDVGGDYFDYLPGPHEDDGVFSVVIGDITGHGVDAALLMASARGFLRMRVSQRGTVEDVVMAMNKHLTGDMEKSSRFMSLFFLKIDTRKKIANWVRAGHDPVLVYTPETDQFVELKGPGIVLGVDEDFRYQEQCMTNLVPNQIFVLTTDGVVEACNQEGAMFGKKRLQVIVRNHCQTSSESIVEAILQELSDFTSSTEKEDDVTVVVVKITADR